MNTGYTSLTQLTQQSVRGHRERIERILSRAELLDEPERALIKMYLENNNSFRQISLLTGLNQSTVSRRIKRILSRLDDSGIETAIHSRKILTKKQKKVASEFFVRGLTAKEISRKYKMTYYNVLKTINVVRNLTSHKHKTTVRNY